MLVAVALFVSLMDELSTKVFNVVEKSVVKVVVKDEGEKDFRFAGTGFIVIVKGEKVIMTAKHVVHEEEAVGVIENGKVLEAPYWKEDPIEDFAIVPIKTKGPDLKVRLDRPPVGTDVFVVGFPSPGEVVFGPVISMGQVNQREAIPDDENVSFLGISCVLTSGNSGGPVVDKNCKVVGIAVSGYSNTQLYFAVPMYKLKYVF